MQKIGFSDPLTPPPLDPMSPLITINEPNQSNMTLNLCSRRSCNGHTITLNSYDAPETNAPWLSCHFFSRARVQSCWYRLCLAVVLNEIKKKIASECEKVTSGVKSAGLSIRNSSGKAETLQILVSIGSFVIIGEDGISLAAASIF